LISKNISTILGTSSTNNITAYLIQVRIKLNDNKRMTKKIKHLANITYQGEAQLFTFGLPLPAGGFPANSELQIIQNNDLLPVSLTPIAYWDDNTIRWLNCQAIIKNTGSIDIELKANDVGKPLISKTRVPLLTSSDDDVFQINKDSFKASIRLKRSDNEKPLTFMERKHSSKNTPLSETYKITGIFKSNNQQLKCSLNIEVSKKTSDVFIELHLLNPHAAAHPNGQWDLGDNNSVIIDDFSFILQLPNSKSSITIHEPSLAAEQTVSCENNYTLIQYSSGGKNWQSPIHWDENKNTTVHQHGFQLVSNKQVLHQGLRAEPIALLANKTEQLSVQIEGFWQNFPITLTGEKDSLSWQLLTENTELQGGESKTWRFKCHNKTSPKSSSAKESTTIVEPLIHYNTDYLTQCNIMPHIAFSNEDSALNSLINAGINKKTSFFEKREKNDIYGWRHYGELDADHEAINIPEGSYFISHYNNQYDPLMGMTLQFLHQGNSKWLQLLKPLNQHIQDIDIYDTKDDKAEYNGGLFWHTDHYLSAQTCSHRSNSKHHVAAYEGFLGGGGPGGQHCYTTGLTLQYWLFGDKEAKAKVAQLCNWIRNCYDGSGSIAERTFRLLTIDFKQNVLTNIGIKAPGYKYPLDRGTGNFLIALIDHYDLCEAPKLLKEMGQVIKQTIHPLEDINLRRLDDHENTWFYTVFLQAIVRYLLLKESRHNIDDDYWFARHAFMHYCHWMVDNECFYLDHPEQLEFPNDTWCAQELRKANLFYYAYYFSKDNDSHYIEQAEKFYKYVTNHLNKSTEANNTRILSILMQNNGVQQKFKTKPTSPISYKIKKYNDAPVFSRRGIIFTYIKDMLTLLLNFSPQSEWSWLTQRLSRIFAK